ncbi:MAG: PQQ-like beta-propeller repeat protein [Planctomycetes bacterium]|nr:PQQ-like beta-propeller repeat protein [Planctomycetota bacterium]
MSACVVMLCCAGSRAQSVWTHLAHDPGRVSIASSVPPSLAKATWIMGRDAGGAPISFVGQAGVVADESRVYAVGEVNGAYMLFAIDHASGTPVWSAAVAPWAFESWSTPAIDMEHRTVIVAAGDEVSAFECASGSRVWTAVLARTIVNASPVVTSDLGPTDRVFITDYDGFGAGSRLYCINVDPRDATANPFQPGEIVWSVAIGRATGSTPAYRNGVVYVATAGGGITENGRVLAYAAGAVVPPPPLWTFTNPTPAPFVGGVSVRAEGAGVSVYAASYSFSGGLNSGNLVKLDGTTGALLWSIEANRTASIPVPLADGRIVLAGGIMGFGSAPSVELFEDLGSSARRVWNTALDTWVDTNGNGVMEPGEFLLVGGWTTQPIVTSAGVLLVGAVPATGSSFGACTDLYAIDLSRRPMESGFVLGSFAGAGSSPAAVAGALYTVGREGVHAFGTCYADCDRSTGAGRLDIFDFLCFQSSFVSGESYACQCDVSTGPNVCDLFDFLCFQNAFVGGCP